ncbi:Sorting nexin-29 [Armadillidium nasatum]|uniref:Sorting nexin-29 n=1 Tax=Armadillidium nasatum TaxID=96803 RepID=A0A5N5T7J0_9CRUS|nr:Sorting nexin-29 [Armadillidium nasatum]
MFVSLDDGDSQRKLEIKRKKKKKIPSQLVSFDEEFLSQSYSSYPCESPPLGCFSAPSTSINSPAATSLDQGISKFDKLVGDEEIKKAKQKLESVISEHSETSMKTSANTSSRTLPLNRRNIHSSETELSYNQALEDLLASEISNESVATAIFDVRKTEKLKMEQETGSYKSIASNMSYDSFQSSEDVGGLPSLLPLEGGTGGLIPLSPEGEVLFNVGIAQDDETSLKSSSQDEFEINECSAEDVDKKRMSNSSSVGSVASAGSGPPSSNSKCSTVTPSSFSSLTFDELRTAVLEISRTRDASEQKRAALATALNTEMEISSTLRAQFAQEQAQHMESVDRLSSKVNALTRENELLRHQLKKYIGAVQMLRRDTDSQSGEDSVFSLPSKNPPEIRDYHDEAAAYEGKLIQVAEMHGELMEFNERLQRLLRLRESQVQRLREELVELRGPFPTAEEDDDLDETLSVTSDFDSISPSPRTLINIWIPTAFLAGPSSDTHHVYQIYVRIKDDEWNVYRRFAQFYELHKRFKKKDSTIRTFDFPQKKAFGNKDISVVEDRRIRLQLYLRQLINFLVSSNLELASQPSKATLTTLLPFLLDSTLPKEISSKTTSRRKFLSRLSTRQELSPPTQSSPQYNGL